jgi:hypothetical protein
VLSRSRSRDGEVLVLAHQRGGGDFGDHQAGVEAGLSASGRRQVEAEQHGSTISATRRCAMAPISARWRARSCRRQSPPARRGNCRPRRSGRRPAPAGCRCGIGLDLQRAGRLAQDIHRGAGHLRLAADAIGILHALSPSMWLSRISEPSSRARMLAARPRSGRHGRAGVDFGLEGRGRAHDRIGRQRRDQCSAARAVPGANRPASA